MIDRFDRGLQRFMQRAQAPIKKRFFSKGAFTLLEIAIVIIVIVIIIASALALYRNFIRKSEESEALINLNAIKIAEEMEAAAKGTYVNAADTEDINRKLATELVERIFRYRVENATKDSYVAIAERIDDEGEVNQTIILAMGPAYEGIPRFVYHGSPIAGGTGYGDLPGFGGYGGGPGGSGGTAGGGSSGIGVGGGASSGGTSSSSPGGSGGSPSSGSGGSNTVAPTSGTTYTTPTPTYSTELEDALSLLQADIDGAYYYNLIQRKQISVLYVNPADHGFSSTTIRAWWDVLDGNTFVNTIYLNERLQTTDPAASVAATIAHEVMHADYFYYPETHIAETLARHTEISRADLNISRDSFGREYVYTLPNPETGIDEERVFIYNSIDQEYMCRVDQTKIWSRNKGSDSNYYLDTLETLFAQPDAEAQVKAYIESISSYSGLPDF